jgi:hypothetical protein
LLRLIPVADDIDQPRTVAEPDEELWIEASYELMSKHWEAVFFGPLKWLAIVTGPRISTRFEAGYRPWSRPFGPVHDHFVSSVNAHVHEVILSGEKLPAAHPESSCSLRLPAAKLRPKLRLRTDCHGNRLAHGGQVRLTQRITMQNYC